MSPLESKCNFVSFKRQPPVHCPTSPYRSSMQPAASEKLGLYLTIHVFLSLLSLFKVLEKHKEVDCGFEATKG